MLAEVDPSLAACHSRTEQIVALIRQNAELEVRLAGLQSAASLQDKLAERDQVER